MKKIFFLCGVFLFAGISGARAQNDYHIRSMRDDFNRAYWGMRERELNNRGSSNNSSYQREYEKQIAEWERQKKAEELEKLRFTVAGNHYYSEEPMVPFGEHGAMVFKYNERYGLLYEDILILSNEYDQIGKLQSGLARIRFEDRYGYINEYTETVIPFQYEDAHDFLGDFASAKLNGEWGIIDRSGKEIIPFSYEASYGCYQGYVGLKLNGKWGIIDLSGAEVIPFRYDDLWAHAWPFERGGLAPVKLDGKWGFVNAS